MRYPAEVGASRPILELAGVLTGIADYLGGLIGPEWVFSVSESREVMNIRQASQYLGVSPDTLYRYITEGEIPAFKLGNRWKFRKTILDRWMERKMSQGHGKKRWGQFREPRDGPRDIRRRAKQQRVRLEHRVRSVRV